MLFAVRSPRESLGWPAYFRDPETGKPFDYFPEESKAARQALMDALNPFVKNAENKPVTDRQGS